MPEHPKLGLIVRDTCQLSDSLKNGRTETVETKYGAVTLKTDDKWAAVCRSGFDENVYLMPHEYNTLANLKALQTLGVSEVVGVHSSGSLRPSLAPGMLMIPDDWICFEPQVTTIRGRRKHLTPGFSNRVRQNLASAAWKVQVHFENGGTYWQTEGPRLETKAEIKLMSSFADLVGMAMVSEATLAQEMEIEYGAICSVDNYANGLGRPRLTDEMIVEQCLKNAAAIVRVLDSYLV
ncbi:6-oxopurine nucleoside phosphorylase [Deltaproteobacteria bacterium Smac51]|nr:6-oxopurine nucleoside phosphorylase [Deltaproteobacteria bacterium Smac51]